MNLNNINFYRKNLLFIIRIKITKKIPLAKRLWQDYERRKFKKYMRESCMKCKNADCSGKKDYVNHR